MKKFIFGTVPSAALKPPDTAESSKSTKKPASELHQSSWSNLYHRLIGPGDPTAKPNAPDDEYVRWDGSSSPIGRQRKLEMSTSSPNRVDDLESSRLSVARLLKPEDPATELFNKYNSNTKTPNLSCPDEHEFSKAAASAATPCRRTASAFAAPSAAKTTDVKSTILPPLYSPGYLKRSISFDRGLGAKKKRQNQDIFTSMPDQRPSHVQELLNLADDIASGVKTVPSSPDKNANEMTDIQQPKSEASEENDEDWDMDELERLISQQETQKASKKQLKNPSQEISAIKPALKPALESGDLFDPADFEDSSDTDLDLQELDKQIAAQTQAVDIKTIIKPTREQKTEEQPLFSTVTREDCIRLRVITVEEQKDQVVLSVIQQNPQKYNQVILKQHWHHEVCIEPGDIINVILRGPNSDRPQGSTIIVDNKQNLVIVNPDLLLTATAVAESAICRRKVVLRERVKVLDGELSKYIVFGSIIHELFQDCLVTNNFLESYVSSRLSELVRGEFLSSVILAGLSCQQAEQEIHDNYLGTFCDWKRKYFSGAPNSQSVVSDHRGGNQKPLISITKVLDIEQEIWSPVFGLKGKIDATVEAHFKDQFGEGKHVVPFELKTSKSSQSITHRAQTVLYTLLLSESNQIQNTPFGILCYIAMDEMIRVGVLWDEVRALIIARNTLAAYSKTTVRSAYEGEFQADSLPAPLADDFLCKRCDWNQVCMVHHFAQEDSTSSSPVPEIYEAETAHLTPKHREFFNHWMRLLNIEGGTFNHHRKQIWTMSSKQRESTGSCFGDLKIVECSAQVQLTELSAEGKSRSFYYVLAPKNGEKLRSLSESLFRTGEYVVVSDENGHVFLASGLLLSATNEAITISVHRKLDTDRVYRIDRDELYAGISLARANVVQLFVRSGDARRRDLIVDLKQPRFLSAPPRYHLENGSKFNKDQVAAIEKVLRAEDYALILGMPGTGKTTTIAALISILVKQLQKTVLIASHTHSAVDNILLKFKDEQDMSILRLGAARKIHPDVHRFLPNKGIENEEQLNQAYMKPSLVATTCLGINEWIFSRRRFDYCIIDEASQITLPSCIGPLRYADKFVLVGDHYQLSPLVRNPKASDGGLDVSLFKHLCTTHPRAIASLEHQYRMCEDIMLLSNTLIYDGRLKCGTVEVAQRQLELMNKSAIQTWKKPAVAPSQGWLERVLDGKSKVVFLNTDELPGKETVMSEGIRNETEASIAKLLVDSLLACGIQGSGIGVISVYKAQVHQLQKQLAEARVQGVEILTADRAQGRDKDCVIVSLVRSNDKGKTGDLLQDWRRLNVAFTRSKAKLVIIGSHKTLEQVAMLKQFLDLISSKGWICTIPAGGLEFYDPPTLEAKTREGRIETKVSYDKIASKRGILRDVINEMA